MLIQETENFLEKKKKKKKKKLHFIEAAGSLKSSLNSANGFYFQPSKLFIQQ